MLPRGFIPGSLGRLPPAGPFSRTHSDSRKCPPPGEFEISNLLMGEAPWVPNGGKPAVSPGPVKSPGPRARSNARTGGPRG